MAKNRQKRYTEATSGKAGPVPATSPVSYFLHATWTSVTLSLALFVVEIELKPLFGSVATKLYLDQIALLTVVCSVSLPLPSWIHGSQAALCVVFCSIPPAIHWIGDRTATLGDPIIGASLAYAPVLLLASFLATDDVRKMVRGRAYTVKALCSLALALTVTKSKFMWLYWPYDRAFSQPLLLVVLAWLTLLGSQSAFTQGSAQRHFALSSCLLPLTITAVAFSLPPLRFHALPFDHPNGLLRILSSAPSVTGRIVVGEDYTHNFRYLRADHSLLGGVWIGKSHLARLDGDTELSEDKNGMKLGDSIYSTFVLQEATRLQVRDEPQRNVLIVGLGTGVAAQAFMQHGLHTSIVEIDPAVYDAARDFFGLSEPSAVYIEDARGWTARRAKADNGTYDIVVHDCFSGGGVPAHLFTDEFWKDVKGILDPNGIVAVNYAGLIGSDSSKAVLSTLRANFRQCRVFHDYKTDISNEELMSEFINLVFFCSPSEKPLEFRPSERRDYLSSYLRDHVLRLLPEREVDVDLILGDLSKDQENVFVLSDSKNPLGSWEDAGALDHWKVMRTILPGYVWSTY